MVFCRSLTVVALVLGLSAPSWATDPVDAFFPYDPVALVPWSGQLQIAVGSEYHRADHGDLNSDGLPDVVALQGTQAVYICSPGNYEAMHESSLPGDVADVAIARCDDYVDTLFTAGPLGLREHPFDTVENQFAAPTVVDSTWSSVTQLRAHGGPGGLITLSGVDDGGLTVRVLTYVPGVGFGQFSSFSVPVPVIDTALVGADGFATPNLALLREDGVTFHDTAAPSAELSPILRSSHPVGSITAFSNTASDASDLLAWVTPTPNGLQQILLLVDSAGVEYGTIGLDFPPHQGDAPALTDFLGLRSGDVDGDGFSDLILSAIDTGMDYVLWNKATVSDESPEFGVGPGNYAMVDLGPGTLTTVAGEDDTIGMLADFDDDGQLDYARPMSQTGGLYIRSLLSVDEYQIFESTRASLAGDFPEYELLPEAGELRLTMELPEVPLVDATHIQVILWRHLGTDMPGSAVQGDAYLNHVYKLAIDVGTGLPGAEQVLAIEIPESGGLSGFGATYYYVELRMIRIEDGADWNDFSDRGGPTSVALHVAVNLSDWDDFMLNELARDGDPIPVTIIDSSGQGPAGGGLVGAVAPLVRLPRFTEADLPKPGAITAEKDATLPAS